MSKIVNINMRRWWNKLTFNEQKQLLEYADKFSSISADVYSIVRHIAKEFGLSLKEAKYVVNLYVNLIKQSNPRMRYRHFPGEHYGKGAKAADKYRERILDDLDFLKRTATRAKEHTGKIPQQLKKAITKLVDKLENVNMIIMQHRVGLKKNPPKPATEIYDTILAIEARKGNKSLWPKQDFRHEFKSSSKAKIYGLSDGSLLIKSTNGKHLWKNFDGYREGIDY